MVLAVRESGLAYQADAMCLRLTRRECHAHNMMLGNIRCSIAED